jgi:hypothetical protein
LDAKLRAGISTHITGEAAEKLPLVAMIVARQEEYEETHDRPMTGRQLVLIVRQYFEVRQDERITYDLSDLMDLTYPGDHAMEYFAERWDDMVRNMRRGMDEGELETIFYRKIKSSEALAKHLGRYELAERGDADRSYTFLRKMVAVKVRDLRQNRNRDDLVHNQFKANKGPSKIQGAPASFQDKRPTAALTWKAQPAPRLYQPRLSRVARRRRERGRERERPTGPAITS